MTFFAAVLYAAILGVLFEHSFHIAPSGGPSATNINVTFYIRRDNVLTSGTLLLLFIIDWICFHILFGTSNNLTFDPLNGWLLFAYLPALLCLGLTVVFSYECTARDARRRFCLTAGFYHSFALLAELTWVLSHVQQLFFGQDGNGRFRFSLIVVLIAYPLLRGFLAAGYFYCYAHPAGVIRPGILGFPSLFIKPAFLVALRYTIPEILVGGK